MSLFPDPDVDRYMPGAAKPSEMPASMPATCPCCGMTARPDYWKTLSNVAVLLSLTLGLISIARLKK